MSDGLQWSVFADADNASNTTDRQQLVSGVARLLGGAAVPPSSRNSRCVTLASTEGYCVFLAKGSNEDTRWREQYHFFSQSPKHTISESGSTASGPNYAQSMHVEVTWHVVRGSW